MAHIREYIQGIIAVVTICGILCILIRSASARSLVKMLCGLFLTLSILRPVSRIDFTLFEAQEYVASWETEPVVYAGAQIAHQERVRIIKEQTEAYILDKAAQIGITVTADVCIRDGDPPVPMAVSLCGVASAYTKQQLAQILEKDLGIPKENQQWTG